MGWQYSSGPMPSASEPIYPTVRKSGSPWTLCGVSVSHEEATRFLNGSKEAQAAMIQAMEPGPNFERLLADGEVK